MNLLADPLPTAVEIDGVEYEVNTDFRYALRAILAFEDETLVGIEKQIILLDNLYPVMPNNISEALRLAGLFLNGGKENGEDAEQMPRLYSFSKDANLIYAAFKQTHGIDLSDTEYLHWWKFLALFMDLGSDTAFCNLVGLRKRVKIGTATKEERQAAREMGDLFDVPEFDNRSLEEKEQEAEFLQMLEKGKIHGSGL